jgi:hypothetical protein
MPWVGSESTIPVLEREKTYHDQDREATCIVFSLFNDADSTSDCIVSNWAIVNNQLERMRKEVVVAKFKESFGNPTKIDHNSRYPGRYSNRALSLDPPVGNICKKKSTWSLTITDDDYE